MIRFSKLLLLLLFVQVAFSQVHVATSMYIANNGSFRVNQGTMTLASGGLVRSRAFGVDKGLKLSSSASISVADETTYVDNSIKRDLLGSNLYFYPLASAVDYAPALLTTLETSTEASLQISFSSGTAVPSLTLGSGLEAIYEQKFWSVNSDLLSSERVSLTLGYSSGFDVSTFTGGQLNRLVIVGLTTSGTWVELTSAVDAVNPMTGVASTLTKGSVTASNLDISQFSHFTFGILNDECYVPSTPSDFTKTWDGSIWIGGTPTLRDRAILNAPYLSGSFSCYSLELNHNVSLANGEYLEVVSDVTGSGKIFMASEASFIQILPTAIAPTIELTKVTRPMRRLDYTYLSSPINNPVTYFDGLKNKNTTAVNGNYGQYPNSSFHNFLVYNTTGLAYQTATNSNIAVGKGISVAVNSQVPYSTSTTQGSWFTQKLPIHIKTTGVANNGNIDIPLPYNGWLLLGNPYPGAIDGAKILEAGGNNIRKTLYYWTFNTPRATWSNSGSNYNSADYATWNLIGGVASCPTCVAPTGKIASTQAVMVRSVTPTPTTLTLNNCMRLKDNNTNFYRLNPNEVDKFWLNLDGSEGSFSQILIAYHPSATNGHDEGLDAIRLGNSTTSVLNSYNNSTKYAIQTRATFTDNDSVDLSIDRPITENLSISLGDKQGVFAQGQSIYLHDTALGVYHDLSTGPYNFVLTDTFDATRFDVVYQNSALGTPGFETQKCIAFVKESHLNVQASFTIDTIAVYDMSGRFIANYNSIDDTVAILPFEFQNAMYVLEIFDTDGNKVVAKVAK